MLCVPSLTALMPAASSPRLQCHRQTAGPREHLLLRLGNPVVERLVAFFGPTGETQKDGDRLAGVVTGSFPERTQQQMKLVGLAGSGVAEDEELVVRMLTARWPSVALMGR